jgi:hypothetical protein
MSYTVTAVKSRLPSACQPAGSEFRISDFNPARCRFALLLIFLGSSIFIASAQSTNGPARPEYSAFKIVNDRNIFNPHRHARSGGVRETRTVNKLESFSLVGTMSYEKGTFAFFDGSKADYRKVVKPADVIAGYTVLDIAPDSVKLASATNQVQLPVGKQMRREEEGDWELAATETATGSRAPIRGSHRSGVATSTQPEPSVSTTNAEPQVIIIDSESQTVVTDPVDAGSTNGAPEAASNSSDDPVLRRLMQRREQEINR